MNTYFVRYNLNDGQGDRKAPYLQAATPEEAVKQFRDIVPEFKRAGLSVEDWIGHRSPLFTLKATRQRWAQLYEIAI